MKHASPWTEIFNLNVDTTQVEVKIKDDSSETTCAKDRQVNLIHFGV